MSANRRCWRKFLIWKNNQNMAREWFVMPVDWPEMLIEHN